MKYIQNLQPHIQIVLNAHQDLAKTPENTVRGFDNETPYIFHPLWCSSMIATEPLLSRDLRIEEALAFLYHDVLEDTNASLPSDLSANIQQSIENMTFQRGMRQEMDETWMKEPKIRLFKLHDKVSNLLDATWMSSEYQQLYVNYTKRLVEDVEQQFGILNITKIAHAILG